MAEKRKGKKIKVALLIILAVLVVVCGGFYLYTLDYYHADQTTQQVLAATDGVTATQSDNMIIFLPEGKQAKAGFIFYPGGKVEHTAYAKLMRAIAREGYACVLLKMPFNLAVFDINAADRAMAALPQITKWLVGGHSLGGSMAAAWCATNPAKCTGLVLLGSYTANDLSKTNLKALVVIGSEDKVLNQAAYENSKLKMPKYWLDVVLEGGNHGQFGNYGEQKGDGKATISSDEQQALTAKAIVHLFEALPLE